MGPKPEGFNDLSGFVLYADQMDFEASDVLKAVVYLKGAAKDYAEDESPTNLDLLAKAAKDYHRAVMSYKGD